MTSIYDEIDALRFPEPEPQPDWPLQVLKVWGIDDPGVVIDYAAERTDPIDPLNSELEEFGFYLDSPNGYRAHFWHTPGRELQLSGVAAVEMPPTGLNFGPFLTLMDDACGYAEPGSPAYDYLAATALCQKVKIGGAEHAGEWSPQKLAVASVMAALREMDPAPRKVKAPDQQRPPAPERVETEYRPATQSRPAWTPKQGPLRWGRRRWF